MWTVDPCAKASLKVPFVAVTLLDSPATGIGPEYFPTVVNVALMFDALSASRVSAKM
jgi:hypothetical protein